MKLQKSVLREVRHIAIGTVACAAVGAGFAVFNFVLLGFTMQRAAGNAEKAKQIAQFSYSVRMLLTCVVAILGFQLGALNGIATALALFFPRITISVMQLLGFYKPQPKEAPAA